MKSQVYLIVNSLVWLNLKYPSNKPTHVGTSSKRPIIRHLLKSFLELSMSRRFKQIGNVTSTRKSAHKNMLRNVSASKIYNRTRVSLHFSQVTQVSLEWTSNTICTTIRQYTRTKYITTTRRRIFASPLIRNFDENRFHPSTSSDAMNFFTLLVSVACLEGVCSAFKLQILHTNDMHAHFAEVDAYASSCPPKDAKAGKCYGGFARIRRAAIEAKEEARKKNVPSIFLNAGDTFQGTPYYTVYKWRVAASIINTLGLDVMVSGYLIRSTYEYITREWR